MPTTFSVDLNNAIGAILIGIGLIGIVLVILLAIFGRVGSIGK